MVVLSVKCRFILSAYQTPQPEAVLFLGGGNTREPIAAQLAAQNLNLQVWVSSRLRPAQVKQFFKVFDDEHAKVHPGSTLRDR